MDTRILPIYAVDSYRTMRVINARMRYRLYRTAILVAFIITL
jgi:hypothetical protein